MKWLVLQLSVVLCFGLLLPVKSQAKDPAGLISTYRGMADASAAEALSGGLFVVADDEDNTLRIYSKSRPGLPLHSTNLHGFLRIKGKKKESDLEGAARVGDLLFWISSHGANSQGKFEQSRHRLFATRLVNQTNGIILQPVGDPYTNLLADLSSHPKLKFIDFGAAANKPPKSPGALNLEGLAATPDGGLLLGFRNPLIDGKALLVQLKNPTEVIAGKRALLGDPIYLDMDQQGVRSLELWKSSYLILGGSVEKGGQSTLYEWNGVDPKPKRIKTIEGDQFNAEALTLFSESSDPSILILSDDGAKLVGDVEAKRLKDPSRKEYRSMEIPGKL